ncbi:MAG: hypothetical protein KBD15_03335, partial [Candidatus Magasanikbacteria bacterium]|nr:hypothetical protein [Candidatus Magasanikbacteria bacterium]
MLCPNCSKPVVAHAPACAYCGTPLPQSSYLPQEPRTEIINGQEYKIGPMTKEEYLASTRIESAEQAASYLLRIRLLFILVTVNSVIIQLLEEHATQTIYYIGLLVGLGVIIYFVYFCAKVLKACNRERWEAIFC